MSNLNLVVIEGILDDDVLYYGDEINRAYFSIQNERINHIGITVYGHLADVCKKYMEKGSHVLVSGCIKSVDNGFILEGKEVKFLSSKINNRS